MKSTTLLAGSVCFIQAWLGLANNNVCSTGIYAILQPLANYAPAQVFCSAHVPPATTTVAKAKRHIAEAAPNLLTFGRRNAKKTTTTVKPTTTNKPTTTTCKPAITPQDPHLSLLSSLEKQAASIVTTFCSCIETPITVTVSYISILSPGTYNARSASIGDMANLLSFGRKLPPLRPPR
jgi:hypothetical protein